MLISDNLYHRVRFIERHSIKFGCKTTKQDNRPERRGDDRTVWSNGLETAFAAVADIGVNAAGQAARAYPRIGYFKRKAIVPQQACAKFQQLRSQM